jgi:hypothetical protein
MRKKLIAIGLVAVLAMSVGATAVFAGGEQIPSAKAAFATTDAFLATANKAQSETPWFTIVQTQVKTGEPKDLVIDVSAECSLITGAKLSGTAGSEALAEIQFRVLVDGVEAVPGAVTFANRLLRVTGDLSHHYGGFALEIDDHWIEIYISTKAAHSFNFAIENVGSGVHTIEVQTKLKTDENGLKGEADAVVGNVSVVVDEVMFKVLNAP